MSPGFVRTRLCVLICSSLEGMHPRRSGFLVIVLFSSPLLLVQLAPVACHLRDGHQSQCVMIKRSTCSFRIVLSYLSCPVSWRLTC